jgi:exodeoxyribonuclease V gamma subunit
MPLTIHQSNRLELLADGLSHILRSEPLPPLMPECLIVQNSGMREWLHTALAERMGVAMNLQCLFPAQFAERVLVESPISPI